MTPQELEQQIHALHNENQALRAELERIQQRAQRSRETKGKVARIGWRVLIPILDRHKVVRSFAKMANTASGFAGPADAWPTRDDVLVDAKTFIESCVRFVVRRRLFLLIFSIIASTIPIIQLIQIDKQNTIIENQNDFLEIQTYDILVKSLSEQGKRGDDASFQTRLAGALMANVKLEFMEGVIEEAFDSEFGIALRPEELDDAELQYRKAGFRGHLMRSTARGVSRRARDGMELEELYPVAQPMFAAILRDAADRLPRVMRLGRGEVGEDFEEDALYYIYQVGLVLKIYARLSRAVEEEEKFFDNARLLFQELSRSRFVAQSRFVPVFRATMTELLIDLGLETELSASVLDVDRAGVNPEEASGKGLEKLRAGLGDEEINWKQLQAQIGIQ